MFEHNEEMVDEVYNLTYKKHQTFNPFTVAEDNGIKIKYVDFLTDPKGLSLTVRNQPYILINSELQESNMRFFICAHELFHSLEHDGFSYYYISFIGAKGKFEREANIFATCLMSLYYKDMFDLDVANYVDVVQYFQIPKAVYQYDV